MSINKLFNTLSQNSKEIKDDFTKKHYTNKVNPPRDIILFLIVP